MHVMQALIRSSWHLRRSIIHSDAKKLPGEGDGGQSWEVGGVGAGGRSWEEGHFKCPEKEQALPQCCPRGVCLYIGGQEAGKTSPCFELGASLPGTHVTARLA